MNTMTESANRHGRIILYIIVAIALVALIVAGLLVYSSAKSSREAEEKASQLIKEFQNDGALTPSQDQIVRVLGTDGGAVCQNPTHALTKATLFSMLANGSGGPGIRPVIADSRLLQGELLIIKVYCPDKQPSFQQLLSSLKTADVASE